MAKWPGNNQLQLALKKIFFFWLEDLFIFITKQTPICTSTDCCVEMWQQFNFNLFTWWQSLRKKSTNHNGRNVLFDNFKWIFMQNYFYSINLFLRCSITSNLFVSIRLFIHHFILHHWLPSIFFHSFVLLSLCLSVCEISKLPTVQLKIINYFTLYKW